MTSQDSESLYKSLFDNMLDGLALCQMVFDTQKHPIDFKYIEVNKNFEALMGLKNAEGKKVTELIPGIRTSNPELLEMYGRVSLTGKPEKFETFNEPLAKWFLVSVYSPRKEYFIAVFQNITDRKKIEKDLYNAKVAAGNVLEDLQVEKEALARAKAKDDAMLSSIGDSVIIVDPNGIVTFINQSAQNLLGWKDVEIIGKFLFDVIPVEDEKGERVPMNARPMAVALALNTTATPESTSAHGIYYYTCKDRTKLPVAVTVAPVMLETKIVGAIEVFRDITKEKELDRAKSEFISIASHQMRTPLTAIQWVAERFMKKEKLTPKGQEYLSDIHASAMRLTELVTDMLSLSRIEAGKLETTPEIVGVVGFVKSYLQEIAELLGKKELEVVFEDHPVELAVKTDAVTLRNIVQNIIINAIDYTPNKGRIKIAIQKKDGTFVMQVADTGIGIPKGEQHKIFEKFTRASNAKLHKTDGTGIGLYIASRGANLLGGKIWFTSEEKKGSTFYVELPLEIS